MAKIKTRARALDMLGRQQIAGIPTALSELFKNAHDAYADNVEVDYIRKKNLLILRDDGLGMTRQEFEQRWLTIGTDSKFEQAGSLAMPVADDSKKHREIMGEKGIGRLSIAAIGPQVLVLTRAKRDGENHNLVAAFVNWSLFTLPNLDLDDIEIPMLEVTGGKTITKKQLQQLITESKENLEDIQKKIPKSNLSAIRDNLDKFDLDPVFWAERLKNPSLLGDNDGGTHFFISPVDEVLSEDIELIASRKGSDQASRLEKALLGFTNTMYTDAIIPILTKFRDHTIEGECKERIGESTFFTPEEFEMADHHIEGGFNEFGQFIGTVQVYGEKKQEYILPWMDGKNRPVACGPFRIKLACIQGTLRESKLPTELWTPLYKKTNLIGGLYVYRDGIRVLPYGDTNNDFLNIESRRSKSAKDYFFSHRRMFGAFELTKKQNSSLQEKAGREGFIENKAYKQFRAILENFFIQLATDFFVDKGDLSSKFIEGRNRQNAEHELLKKRSKLVKNKKIKLEKELNTFFDKLDNDYWKQQCEELTQWVKHAHSAFDNSTVDLDDIVFRIENHIKIEFATLTDALNVNRPKGVGLGKELTRLWDHYQSEKTKLQSSILLDCKNSIDKELLIFEEINGDSSGLRRRFSHSIEQQKKHQQDKLSSSFRTVSNAINEVQEMVKNSIKENRSAVKLELNNIDHVFASTSFLDKSNKDLFFLKNEIEEKIETSSNKILAEINRLTDQILTVKEGSDEHTISSQTLTQALESELETLREEQQNNIDMVQLGMAIGVIHHEFEGNVRGIRKSLRELKKWAAMNPELDQLYQNLRGSFDHLDGYLTLFTPLSRRLNRKKVHVTGGAILDFIKDVFEERFKKDDIELKVSPEFLNQSMFSYPSSIYPAFVNIIDNAAYWLEKNSSEKVITLGCTENGFYIEDNGTGISIRDSENIFEFGFSRKPNGRGMGLYVSKKTLDSVGIQLTVEAYNPNKGACFIIEPKFKAVMESNNNG